MTALEYVHEHMNFRSNKAMLSTSNPADDSTPNETPNVMTVGVEKYGPKGEKSRRTHKMPRLPSYARRASDIGMTINPRSKSI
jgi:hypothetical protein